MSPTDEIYRLLDQLADAVEDLRQAINDVLAKIPGVLGWVADRILDAWNWLCDKLGQLWAKLRELLAQAGSPDALREVGDTWAASVGGPVSGRAPWSDGGALRVDDSWAGGAAEQYRQILPAQQGAMAAIKAHTDGIGAALSDLKTGIYAFWVGAGAAVAAIIIGVLGALTATGTILGAPAAPVIAAGAVVAGLCTIAGGVVILSAAASSANSALLRLLTDDTAYPTGSWPRGALP